MQWCPRMLFSHQSPRSRWKFCDETLTTRSHCWFPVVYSGVGLISYQWVKLIEWSSRTTRSGHGNRIHRSEQTPAWFPHRQTTCNQWHKTPVVCTCLHQVHFMVTQKDDTKGNSGFFAADSLQNRFATRPQLRVSKQKLVTMKTVLASWHLFSSNNLSRYFSFEITCALPDKAIRAGGGYHITVTGFRNQNRGTECCKVHVARLWVGVVRVVLPRFTALPALVAQHVRTQLLIPVECIVKSEDVDTQQNIIRNTAAASNWDVRYRSKATSKRCFSKSEGEREIDR